MSQIAKDLNLLDSHLGVFNYRNLRRIDWPLVSLALILAAVGIVLLISASEGSSESPPYYVKQAIYLALGVCVALTLVCIDYRFLISIAPLLFAIPLVLLGLTLSMGTEAKGGTSWLVLGPFRMQPSEFTKVALVFMLAWYLAKFQSRIQRVHWLIGAFVIAGIPLLLIAKQNDAGTAATLLPIVFVMAFAAGCRVWHLALFMIVGFLLLTPFFYQVYIFYELVVKELPEEDAVVQLEGPPPPEAVATPNPPAPQNGPASVLAAAIVPAIEATTGAPVLPEMKMPKDEKSRLALYEEREFWFPVKLKEHHCERILSFLDPMRDPGDTGWHSLQSKLAIGSGGMWGKGFKKGTQTHLRYLPEYHNDFIFSLLAEEQGFVWASAVVGLLCLLVLRGLMLANASPDLAGSLLAIGCATIIAVHSFVNIAITVGMLPVTGLPLPFLSYGGSFYLTTMACVGTMLAVNVRRGMFA